MTDEQKEKLIDFIDSIAFSNSTLNPVQLARQPTRIAHAVYYSKKMTHGALPPPPDDKAEDEK